MGNGLQKIDVNSIQVFNPYSKVITVRRQIIEVPELKDKLTKLEYYILLASTKRQICDIDEQTLINKMRELFRLISIDVGYIITDDFDYLCTRLFDFIRKYYSQLSLSEIKIAFELAIAGKLDEFLPKGRDNTPDRHHYQQFNIDFFSKILNAYCLKQKNVIAKSFHEIKLIQSKTVSNPKSKAINNYTKRKLYYSLLLYKYTGKLPDISPISVMLFYDVLLSVGLVETHDIMLSDKKEALSILMSKISSGFMSNTNAYQLRKKGVEHDDVKVYSISFAKRRLLIKAFDYIIKNEIQIIDYIK